MKELRIGGQAIVDGVTMRSDHFIASSVRKSDGSIKTRVRKFVSLTDKNKILGLPLLRGTINLVEVIGLGLKEITWSSNESLNENEKISGKGIVLMILFSFVFGIALFKLLPWFLATKAIPLESGNISVNIIDAIIKIILLVGYLLIISLMSDIKTLFMYHGAEHKSVSCYESKKKLTAKEAQKFTTIHPRCGTTFIIIVFVISMLFYIFIPLTSGFWLNFAIRILLLPIIAGVSYEIIRFSGKFYSRSKIVRVLMWPGLQFQRLTTRNPTLKQLEIAIASLNACLEKEKS